MGIEINQLRFAAKFCIDASNHYRPQTKFAKVMFSQDLRCLSVYRGYVHGQGRGCVAGGGGVCVAGGYVWQGGMWEGGCGWQGHVWHRGCAWQGVVYMAGETAAAVGSLHPTGMHSCFL